VSAFQDELWTRMQKDFKTPILDGKATPASTPNKKEEEVEEDGANTDSDL